MAESTRLVDLIHGEIEQFLDAKEPELAGVSRDLTPFIDFSRDLLRGGKRFRALFAYWGWRAVSRTSDGIDHLPEEDPGALDTIVSVATALEFFQAAALVHDDIIDNSDTRRGITSVHRRFEGLHRESEWSGDASAFGRAAGLLAGDLLLAWSEEKFASALGGVPRAAADEARAEFDRMRTEVMLGQYLDVVEELSWHLHDESELLSRALRVIVYKSAKYSVEAPLAIGAHLGAGSPEQVMALRGFGLPLGVAYQLRDDMLGVFGDPSVTGKPAGDDLREGKRTVLVALARAQAPRHVTRFLDELLGDRELDADQVRMLQAAIRDSGAVERVEELIARNAERAREALESAPLTGSAREELTRLVASVTERSA